MTDVTTTGMGKQNNKINKYKKKKIDFFRGCDSFIKFGILLFILFYFASGGYEWYPHIGVWKKRKKLKEKERHGGKQEM